ncbi:hypothetical protein [Bacillus infantis]|uniref:hypothetical protein n=1 Tax=Bacillus infantis TaxID=324767 RepID=UPI003CEC3695
MDNSEANTLEQIKDLVDRIEPGQVYVNQNTYDAVLEKLNFKPSDIVVNNFLPDNMVITLNETLKENMNTGLFPKIILGCR